MFRKKGILRATAIFLLLNTINFTFAPTIAWALTAGPTAPEATSFEPVDTTDMVNLITGDLTYNIPLLEVPGPSGGYPLSLSYHAGIMPNEEASWVGLGWTLNPGAITRMVNGYPDDIQESTGSRRDYWKGGDRHTYELGVTVGVSGVGGVSAGLEFSQDSNLGFGVGMYRGISLGIGGKGSPLSANFRVGINTYGEANASAGISAGIPIEGKGGDTGLKIGVNIGVSTNFKTVQGYGSLGISYEGQLGASISSSGNGLKGSVTAGGGRAAQSNGKAGKISTYSEGFSLPIPIIPGVLSIDLGYKYQRYWSDETSEVKGIGALFPDYNVAPFNDYAFDSYALLDPTLEGGIVENPGADKVTGGSFPAYDSYNVNAQGLSGSMQPYISEHMNLFRQNQRDKDNKLLLRYYQISSYGKSIHFRFNNDFSNKLLSTPASFVGGTATNGIFSSSSYKLTEGSIDSPSEGYKSNHLAGSKHIEYFTNEEIVEGSAKIAGFIDYYKLKEARDVSKYSTDLKKQIGGYMITNESGVTYHYALPAYSYGETQHIQNIEDPTRTFTDIKNTDAYAYTWYLTAVTGPDYVDKNNNGLTDKSDWGYWVKFDYGLWADNYRWRNPAIGTHQDLDSGFENYSSGYKDLYYLNTVNTKTHTAVFVKEIRRDGKGVSDMKDGGFSPKAVDFEYPVCYDCGAYDPDCGLESLKYTLYPTSTLALKEVYLFKNDDFKWNLYTTNTTYAHSTSFEYPGECPDDDETTTTIIYHHGRNVIDIHDITKDIENDFKANALRTIHFNQDYSLCDKTDNSFVSKLDVQNTSGLPDLTKSGKLTLTSLQFLGKGGADLIPAMNFTYGKNPDYDKDAYDMWGLYKSDYMDTGDDNIDRVVSMNSALDVDAWSLTEVETNLGAKIKIEYESDTYNESILNNNYSLLIKDVVPTNLENSDEFTISFHNNSDLTRTIREGDSFDMVLGYLEKNLLYNAIQQSYLISHIVNAAEITSDITYVSPNEFLFRSTKLVDVFNIHNVSDFPGGVWTTSFDKQIGGNLALSNINKCGGGLRVKSIQTESQFIEKINKTIYDYGTFEGFSSGVTSYEPSGLENYNLDYHPNDYPNDNYPDDYINNYANRFTKKLYEKFSNLLAVAREVPAPGVMYEYVTVTDQIKYGQENPIIMPGKTKYHFQVFEKEMVEHNIVPTPTTLIIDNDYVGSDGGWDGESSYTVVLNNNVATIKDHTSKVGRLVSTTTYDNKGNALSKSTNQYVDDDQVLADKFNNQGVIHQSFSELKEVFEGPEPEGLKGVISKREEYPSVLLKTTNTNFKTGITETSETLAFDFYSGAVTKTLSSDGYGNHYVSESTPAYRVPVYAGSETTAGMGLKVTNPNNKHMLTQVASTKAYKVASATDHSPVGLLSAGVQTWSNDVDVMTGNTNTIKQPKIWRKHKSYAFIGDNDNLQPDGTYDYGQFTDFTWWSEATGEPAESTMWQKQSELTLYDIYSHALEATDINGNYAASKMGLDQIQIMATAANASYDEFAYAGMEDVPGGLGEIPARYIHIGGSVYIPNESTVSKVKAHTGTNSLKLSSGDLGFIFTSKGVKKTSRISVWSTSPNVDIKYVVDDEDHVGDEDITTKNVYIAEKLPVKQAGDWYLIRANVSPLNENNYTSTSVTFFCEANESLYLDDFRVHPVDGAMTSYVYNEWDELSHILDANNLFTEYQYDGMGRLEKTYKETFQYGVKKISEVKYNYGRDKKLLAEFTHSGNELANQNLSFNAVANSATLGTATYTWDFGDGTPTQTGVNVNHTYTDSGVYTAKLTVSSADYSSVSKTEVIGINNPLTSASICANGYVRYDYCGEVSSGEGSCTLGTPTIEEVSFNVSMGKLASGCAPYHYQWQKKPSSSWVNFGGDSDSVTEFFNSEGSTDIRCKVTDDCGANITSNTVTIARFKSVDGCTVIAE